MCNRDYESLCSSVRLALNWLADTATVKDNQPVGEKGKLFGYTFWNGAIRGEYSAATRTWNSFCPVWHTGQAVKAYVMASKALQENKWLENAVYSAEFLLAQQIKSGRDAGLICAYEDYPDKVNTSAVLESLDGLFMLSEATGESRWREAALAALDWVADHAWNPELGKFHDVYSIDEGRYIFGVAAAQNRPLLDDAVFITGYHLSGKKKFRDIALATAETLLSCEDPAGNWIEFVPCSREMDSIHPRHAYWWGKPMLAVYRETGDVRFLEAFNRACEWYANAVRKDGGFFRVNGCDFKTTCFEHATSGSACAALTFLDRYGFDREERFLQLAGKCVEYCQMVQFTRASDPNLQGAVLEKLLVPDGSDRLPYHLRDLGTIFFIQAAAGLMQCK